MPETVISAGPEPADAETWTHREILQQPETLRAIQTALRQDAAAIDAFIAPLLALPDLRIVLAGAGTSAFIGECLAPWLSARLDRPVEAIATTDIVSAPSLYLRAAQPTLMLSFGRSGSSPESIAAVDLADTLLDHVHHLVITCNPDGALARRRAENSYVVVLPEATHDRAFAMTSSFTGMMLAALSILTGIAAMDARIDTIAMSVTTMIETCEQQVAALAARRFERVVYLGSGLFQGLAREAALKLLELTDGATATAFDTPLGFRHGPKTMVNGRTLAIVFVSSDPLTRRYDLDIVEELRRDGRCGAAIAIMAGDAIEDSISIDPGRDDVVDADLLFPFIVPAQLFGVHCSLGLGLTPDQPNASGTVNRVVQGVRIHSLDA